MPTPKPLHRTYCKTCKNFTVHSSNYICQVCETEFTPYKPSEVDSTLIEEQRKRYTKQRQGKLLGVYGRFLKGVGIQHLMDDFDKQEVIECDAGQEQIDNLRKQAIEDAKRKAQEILDDYKTNYKHLNRNDKCTCGSGKKYKQCHLLIFREKGVKI
jgi:hypothetical protein